MQGLKNYLMSKIQNDAPLANNYFIDSILVKASTRGASFRNCLCAAHVCMTCFVADYIILVKLCFTFLPPFSVELDQLKIS